MVVRQSWSGKGGARRWPWTPQRTKRMITNVATQRTDRLNALGVRALRTRWLVRAPIWLYRARLGAVLGSRLLMLEHTGRTSGQRRRAGAHPRAWKRLRPVIEAAIGSPISEHTGAPPMIALKTIQQRP